METKKIETPLGKNKIELKEYITGRDLRKIRAVFAKDLEFGLSDGKTETNKIKAGELTVEAENIAIDTVIISIDGERENLVDKVLDMQSEDYEFVIKEINKVTQGDNFLEPAKKQKAITEQTN